MRGLCVHPLTEEAEILHFLTDKAAGEADLLATDKHYFLTVEDLLGYDRR